MAELDLASLVVSVRADVRDAATGIDNLNSKIDSIGKSTEQAGADTARVQREMTQGWVGLSAQLQAFNELSASIGKPLLNFFKGAVNGASDLQETVSKTNVVFKDYASDVLEWSESATRTMGLSKNSALSMASSFGDLATSMGLAINTSQQMAMNLTQLAADLASFKNIDATQAFTALQGIFTGNAQALKGLGVVMNEATLEAYALSQGITTSYNAMSESEKVMLRYNYVLQQTANAQGDFERTGGGFANATRTLSESISELTSSFGEMLLPALETVIGFFTDLVQYINDMPDGLKAIIVALGLAATAFTVIIPLVSKATSMFSALKAVLATTPLGWVAGIAAAITGITALVSSFASAETKSAEHAATIREKVQEIKQELEGIDGNHTATYTISVLPNGFETASSNLTGMAGSFSESVDTVINKINDAQASYNNTTLSIQAALRAVGWEDNYTPNDLPDEERAVSIDGEIAGLDYNGLTPEDKSVDIEGSAKWKPGESPQDKAGEIGIPVYQEGKLIVEAQEGTTFQAIKTYIATELQAIQTLHVNGDFADAQSRADDLQRTLLNLAIQFNDESERKAVDDFYNDVINPCVAYLQEYIKIDFTNDSINDTIDYAKLSKDMSDSLNALGLNLKIASITDNNDEAWNAYKKAYDEGTKAIDALIKLKKATQGEEGADTKEAEELLDKLNAMKEKYETTLDTDIDQTDLDQLKEFATQISILVGADFSSWGIDVSKALEQGASALYKKTTGKDRSGSVYQDILNIKNVINEGFGDDTAWGELQGHISDAKGWTEEWTSTVKILNDAYKSVLTTQLSARTAALTLQALDLADAINRTTDETLKNTLMGELQTTLDSLQASQKGLEIVNKMDTDWSTNAEEFVKQQADATQMLADAGITLEGQIGTYTQELTKAITGFEADGKILWYNLGILHEKLTELDEALPNLDFSKVLQPIIEQRDELIGRKNEYEAARERLGLTTDDDGYIADLVESLNHWIMEVENSPELAESYQGKIDIALDELREVIGEDIDNNQLLADLLTVRKSNQAQIEADEKKMREAETAAFTEILKTVASFNGVGDLNSFDTLIAAIQSTYAMWDKAEGAQKAELADELAKLYKQEERWAGKFIAEALLTKQLIPEDVINQLSESSQEQLRAVNTLIESGAKLTDPDQLAWALGVVGDLMGVNLLQTGATENPMAEGSGDKIDTQNNIYGNNQNGDNYYTYRTYNVVSKTTPDDTLESQVKFENEVDGATTDALGNH